MCCAPPRWVSLPSEGEFPRQELLVHKELESSLKGQHFDASSLGQLGEKGKESLLSFVLSKVVIEVFTV